MRTLFSGLLGIGIALGIGIGTGTGCYSPDYTQRECSETKTCPDGYGCYMARCRLRSDIPATPDMSTPPGDLSTEDLYGVGPLPGEVEMPADEFFQIGTNTDYADGFVSNDRPRNTRKIARFFLDDREVTVAQYRECLSTGPCTIPHTGSMNGQPQKCNYASAGFDNSPVNCVDLNQANAYCKWKGKRQTLRTRNRVGNRCKLGSTTPGRTTVGILVCRRRRTVAATGEREPPGSRPSTRSWRSSSR